MSKRKGTQSAEIIERIQETRDTCTLKLKLSDPFEWHVGQFIMVSAMIDGELVKRAYSISSSPTSKGHLDITVRQTATPTMSKYLNEVQVGDTLDVRGPYGKFIWNHDISPKLVLLGAGSGITPLKAMMEYVRDKNYDTPVILFYSCGHGDNVIFDEELKELSKELKNCKYELSLTREPEEKYPNTRKGRINAEYLEEELKDFKDAHCYLCGSPGFINATIDNLQSIGFDREQIHREQWG